MFLLVVDTCLEDAELEHLRDSLQQVGTVTIDSLMYLDIYIQRAFCKLYLGSGGLIHLRGYWSEGRGVADRSIL